MQEFPVNIHERYEHIANPYALGGLIVSRALMQTSIARLADFDIGSVQSLATSQLQHAQRLLGDAAGAAHQLQSQAVRQLKGPSALTGTAKATAEGVVGAGKEAVTSAEGALKRLLRRGESAQESHR